MAPFRINKEICSPQPKVTEIKQVIFRQCTQTAHLDDIDSDNGRTSFMQAARGGTDAHLEILQAILERWNDRCKYHADQLSDPFKKRDRAGWTALMHAAHGGHVKTLEFVHREQAKVGVEISRSAIDPRNVTGEAAIAFVVDNVFGGDRVAFERHEMPSSTRKNGRSGGVATGAAAVASSDLESPRASGPGGGVAAGGASGVLSGLATTKMAAHGAGLFGISHQRHESDNDGDDEEESNDEDGDRKPSKKQRIALEQNSQKSNASNEISDEDENAAMKADTDNEDIGEVGAITTSRSKSSTSTCTSSSASSQVQRRPYRLPTASTAAATSEAQVLQFELSKYKSIAENGQRQAGEAIKQRDAAIKEKDHAIKERDGLRKELETCRAELESNHRTMKAIRTMLQAAGQLLPRDSAE
mmetsp:Transcript_38480/g.78579  ORF Transcript_38480/g.78579 Transcript_38480/m.78579 type:complete len:415 (+) Transcript_38480:2419-3663(+)